jgi:hypothetical protein
MVRRLRPRSRVLGSVLRRFLAEWPAIASGRTEGRCLALSSNLALSASGRLLACNYRRESLADLRTERLASVWPKLSAARRRLAGPERGCRCANTCFTIPALLLS